MVFYFKTQTADKVIDLLPIPNSGSYLSIRLFFQTNITFCIDFMTLFIAINLKQTSDNHEKAPSSHIIIALRAIWQHRHRSTLTLNTLSG